MNTEPTTGTAVPDASKPRYNMAELLAEAEAAGAYPLPPEEREWVDAPPVGREWPNNEE